MTGLIYSSSTLIIETLNLHWEICQLKSNLDRKWVLLLFQERRDPASSKRFCKQLHYSNTEGALKIAVAF